MDITPINYSTICLLIALTALLFASFIVAGSETALLATIKGQSSQQKGDSQSLSRATLMLIKDDNLLAFSFLVAANIINIATVIITYRLFDTMFIFESAALALTVKFCTSGFFILIVCIYIPKTLAAHNYQKFAQLSSPITLAIFKVFSPISWLLSKIANKISPPLPATHENVSIEQLQSAIEVTSEESPLEEKKILTSIVTFIGREVSTIMKPRVDVTAIELSANFAEVIDTIKGSNFSRIPVYENSFDEISGVLFAKDLIPYINEDENFQWHKLLREPFFVPESKKINELLEDFQAQRRHLAIVVDEYGGTLGVVTLEDILEEIVGEITDETDATSDYYEIITEGVYLFDGSTHIEDFGEVLSLDEEILLSNKGCADTLAGLMMELRCAFFSEGDEVTFEGLTLRAEEVERYRITKVLVTRIND